MLAKIISGAAVGLNTIPIHVEVDVASRGLPSLSIVGLPDKAVQEAKDRFDVAYCGEEPNEASHLHYGYSMGKELSRVGFINAIYKNSVKPFYDYLAIQTLNFSDIFNA